MDHTTPFENVGELTEVEDSEDGGIVLNDGDGWHQIIAAVELNFPVIEIIFGEECS